MDGRYIIAYDQSGEDELKQKWALYCDDDNHQIKFTTIEAEGVVKRLVDSYPLSCIIVAKVERTKIYVEVGESDE